ncbi:GIY-YIG nuclease family protein [Hahella ganghwensis]|uniref:GIY-YIG nuclease family protein n=1 Tax=Hahella ganghwensis TaxID=286420 RepID=UPI000366B65C|nr:GIY-YIG nuclease family protein [Hahella ganghwensis]
MAENNIPKDHQGGSPEALVHTWWVYMILADDQSIYTGITTDIQRRFLEHESGRGARYFRGRRPLKILYTESGYDRSSASRREAAIKKLNRQQKLALVNSEKAVT